MLANYRCNEIKREILESYQERLNELTTNTYNKLMNHFKETCKDLLDKIMGTFSYSIFYR